ncbi:nuclear pore complex protein NUP1 isoform X2 [Tripterygium wilfordii]|uniref:nuclear pore complex protein NUP1 isoform X2 n=1 Tax=Tripterygium wilfordii TaxID=458696 RepID=UPI0018F7F26E|nr:nuclear pore complex protein NUP1 isoform X2 [Tripterygium wilfordii]
MERDAATTSSRPDVPVEARGAGGKLRRPLARRPPSTPYARPQQNGAQKGWWFARLVDPARRIITGGATLVFPSLFSNSASLDALPVSSSQQHHDDLDTDVEQNSVADNHNSKLGLSSSTRVEGPKRAVERSKSSSHVERLEQGRRSDLSDDNGLSEIEQLMEDKSFSTDEINRLIEIMNSRTVDLPHAKQEIKSSSMAAEQDARGAPIDLKNAGTSSEEKLEILNKATWITSTPLPQSILRDEVGASPIDIARAYMEKRTSGMDCGSIKLFPEDGSAQSHSDEFALRPYSPSPFPNPSPCWPGARVQDQRDNVTPRSQRGRFGLQSFPRTPYSRSIYSKSRSKLMQLPRDGNREMNMPSTPLQQSQSPIYGKSRNNDLVDDHESVGPIRRTPRKYSTAARPKSSMSGPLQVDNFHFSEAIFPTVKRTMGTGEKTGALKFQLADWKPQGSEVDAAVVHPHSSQMAKKILEHLERNPATPTDKSAEIQRVTTWNKQHSSDVTAVIPNKRNGSMHLGGFDFSGNKQQVFKQNSHWSENKGDSLFKVPPPRETYDKVMGAVKLKSSASDIKDGNEITNLGDDAEPTQEFWKSQDSQVKSAAEDVSRIASNGASSEVLNAWNSISQPSTAGSKPVLPSICVTKPEQRWMFSSDNSSGFTFPVSSSHGTISEPPTPSVMPSSTASGQLQPKEGSSVAAYSFGTKKSDPALVFSFPSTSNAAAVHDPSPNLQFSFGSETSARISFSSFGKDAICH